MIDAATRAAYLRTIVTVDLGDGWLAACEAARALGSVIHVLTAWNPRQARPSIGENRAANDRLRDEFDRRRIAYYPALGSSPAGDHAEESFAVVGIDRVMACEFGRMFEQAAIFEITHVRQTVVSADRDWEVPARRWAPTDSSQTACPAPDWKYVL